MANGVPALLDSSADPTPEAALSADSPAIQPTSRIPAWGIYDHATSTLAIQADSIVKLEYKATARVSNAPQEEGSFQAYNKVQAPYESRVMMTKGGSESDRTAFLDALEAAKQSLNLYDIVMPEKSYLNANITGYSFTRTARNGVSLLMVELMFEEIRQATGPVFTATTGGDVAAPAVPIVAPKKPSGADPAHAGTVQPKTPTPAQTAPVSERLADAILGADTVVP